jgi:hypothetical protein
MSQDTEILMVIYTFWLTVIGLDFAALLTLR